MDTIEIQRIAEVEDESWWYRERRAAVARELRRIGTPGRAVDIGAAGGGNTRVLAAHGWDAVAVDGSPAAVRLARARGVEAYEGDAAYLPLPSGHFDFAMALDVLEHVEDDRAAAAEMARVLRPGGTALVSVACDLSLWSAHDVVLGRVRRYSRRALAEVIEGAGLLVDRMWSWNVLLRPFVRWRRHRAAGWGLERFHPAVNAGLRAVATLERHLPVKQLPGVTLFARAHRPV
ncbi:MULTISPECIES: class I SAM-dependent methyltransferase [Actinomadura]|uniref:Class I SAM-dependent methyltransferase n=1 Tax=Actinomadura yumaensis TaxID=111807 RepID=A0ABW2CR89_9ACTN|nr:class I SAM-dependent methyltransferase [Actinomadura sp. J1-007]MWK36001.1 methyltransferase domain-containing protein [Actinomadura sp. J1-007]